MISVLLLLIVPPALQSPELVNSGNLPGLRWPNFAAMRPEVARFYASDGYRLAWVREGAATPQARALMTAFQNAALKGLDPKDYDAWRWNRSQTGDQCFDLALTISTMRYVHDLSSGKVEPELFAFGLHFDQSKIGLAAEARILSSSADVAAELRRLEPPFDGYWRTEQALARYLAAARNNTDPAPASKRPLPVRIRQLQLVLERWRWVPHSFPRPPLVVNIPEFRLRAYDDHYRPELEMKVVVGKAYRHKTPVFSAEMTALIFRPYWDVPLNIQREELAPKIAEDPAYLASNDYEIVDAHRKVVSRDAVTADMLDQLRTGELFIRQIPGDKNALGFVKFLIPNPYDVYLHGTPAKALFLRSRRDFSHGCIRVENPDQLAQWALQGLPGWDMDRIHEAERGRESIQVPLDQPIPVLIVYGTAVARPNGEVEFFDDIYGHDRALEQVLDHGYPYSGWQVTGRHADSAARP